MVVIGDVCSNCEDGDPFTATATCEDGFVVLGGGWELIYEEEEDRDNGRAHAEKTFPTGSPPENAWQVDGRVSVNDGDGTESDSFLDGDVSVKVYAVCGKE